MPAVSKAVPEHAPATGGGLLEWAWEQPAQRTDPPPVAQPGAAAQRRGRDGGRPLHRARRLYRVLAPWIAVAAALVWFVALRPVALGGPGGYVVVAGTSMEPLYRTGDLVITRRADSYRPGDVVAFGIPGSGATVIHRIVGGDAEAGYVLRGDNKPHDDLWRPTPDDVLGKAVVHVPDVGGVAALLRSQTALAAAAGVFAFMAVAAPTGAGTGRASRCTKRGRRRRRAGRPANRRWSLLWPFPSRPRAEDVPDPAVPRGS